MYSWTNVEHVKRRCNWHQTFVLLLIAKHSISNWHSTGVHEDWPVANVSLLRQICEWAAGGWLCCHCSVRTCLRFLFLGSSSCVPEARWEMFWSKAVFGGLLQICYLSLTKFLFYLLSCFFHNLPCRKWFTWGNTRFGSSLFTSFMLPGVLLQVVCCLLLDVILYFPCVRVVAALRVVILLHSLF